MATLSNPTYYEAGVTPASSTVVGYENNHTRVVRYTLVLGASESASKISFKITTDFTGIDYYGGSGESYINNKMSLYFHVGTDPNAFANAGYADISKAHGKVTMSPIGELYEATGSASIYLLPNTTYYLWIFPGFSNASGGNGIWGWYMWTKQTANTVTLSGYAGLVNIDTGTGFVKAIPYIDNGSSWKQCIPYLDDGTKFKICSG